METGPATRPVGPSDAEREAVLAELNSILSDPVFKRSHRCVALLRYVVEHALAGDLAGVKERTLGIEVFGRDYNYDSNADPIVRMTANEIRKRLAQYYQDHDTRHGVKIRLTPGRYVPEFLFPPPDPPESAGPLPPQAHQTQLLQPVQSSRPAPPEPRSPSGPTTRRRWIVACALLLLAVAAALVFGRSRFFPSRQYLAWKPLVSSQNSLIICVADDAGLQERGIQKLSEAEKRIQIQRIADMIQSRQAPTLSDPKNLDPTTPFVDANVAHEIGSWLGGRGQSTTLRPSSAMTLEDFRNRPVVLVGGFDNPWTVILLSDMRFSPRVDPAAGTFWIRDAQNPANRDWTRHVLDEPQPTFDYAVITRFFDTETANWILAIGGLGPHGTEAASQLLMDPAYARSLPSGIRSTGNFQIVVGTRLINGNTGPPQIMAFHTW